MADFLVRPRRASRLGTIQMDADAKSMLRKFTYVKVLVPRNKNTSVIAWNILYQGEFMCQVSTLKEVKNYISEKLNT